MAFAAWLVVIAAALYALHRLGLWAEGRGWIYYRAGRGTSGALTSALLEAQSMIEPRAGHVLEALHHDEEDEDHEAAGDPPAAGGREDRRSDRSG